MGQQDRLPLVTSSRARLCESVEASHTTLSLHDALFAELREDLKERHRVDSQVKYGLLARGDARLFLRYVPSGYIEKIWDHAAGALILTEAGGLVTDVYGHPLDWSTGKLLSQNRGILASTSAQWHKKVLSVLKRLL